MIDLFGLRQKDASDSVEPVPDDKAPDVASSSGSHRLWAFLLVLDSIFVIVFSGAVAAKIYRHWESPALPEPTAHRRPTKSPATPVAAAVSSTGTASVKAPEPAKLAESDKPLKPEPVKLPTKPDTLKTTTGAETPRPPKPSMLTEPPKPRSTPTLAAAVSSTPPPAAPSATLVSGKQKAVPVVFKITAPKASNVHLVGAFIVHGGRKEMMKEDGGVWAVKLYLNPGQYRYFFSVDKKKTLDPENPQSDRGASLMTVSVP